MSPGWLALGVVTAATAPLLTRLACRRLGLVKPNFRGERIPAAVGLTFVQVCGVAYGVLAAWPYLAATLAFGALGLIDDLRGDRSVGGFRGHLRALVRGRPTTGSLKLLGGGVAALGIAWWAHRGLLWQVPLDAALIALCANAVNLLDLRPGRALFAFGLLLAPGALQAASAGAFLPLIALLAAAIEWPADARARAMMGDTGANVLGALAGVAAVTTLPMGGRWALLAALLALNLVAERVSLSGLIERTPWLRALDRRLGVRAPLDAPSPRPL